MRMVWGVYIPTAIFVAVCAILYSWSLPVEFLSSAINEHGFASYGAFILLLASATVFAPVTVMPLIPMVAPVFGPFLTGVLSIVGWTLGAAIAFIISRKVGRPMLERFISLDPIDKMVERFSHTTQFMMIVLIRISSPVDVASYALGLSRSISFFKYITATAVGVMWFSFAFAYLGDALFKKDLFVLVTVGSISAVLFIVCWGILIRHTRMKP